MTIDNNPLSQIKVCYDKSLTRVDCDGIKGTGEEEKAMMGTCLRFNCLTIDYKFMESPLKKNHFAMF